MVENDIRIMNHYCDRHGAPLQWDDTVAALRGDEENGYTAVLYTVGCPSGRHTMMLRTFYPCDPNADIYLYIPTDKETLERLKLTRLGPNRSIDIKTFGEWRHEVSQLPNIDPNRFQQLDYRLLWKKIANLYG